MDWVQRCYLVQAMVLKLVHSHFHRWGKDNDESPTPRGEFQGTAAGGMKSESLIPQALLHSC